MPEISREYWASVNYLRLVCKACAPISRRAAWLLQGLGQGWYPLSSPSPFLSCFSLWVWALCQLLKRITGLLDSVLWYVYTKCLFQLVCLDLAGKERTESSYPGNGYQSSVDKFLNIYTIICFSLLFALLAFALGSSIYFSKFLKLIPLSKFYWPSSRSLGGFCLESEGRYFWAIQFY